MYTNIDNKQQTIKSVSYTHLETKMLQEMKLQQNVGKKLEFQKIEFIIMEKMITGG